MVSMALPAGSTASSFEGDATAFFGPRGHAYIAYGVSRMADRRRLPIGWSWPAFGAWFVWTAYRKLWLFSVIAFAVPVLGDYCWPAVGGLVGTAAVAVLAKEACLQSLRGAIAEADRLGLSALARREFLARRGGVSPQAALLATLLGVALGAVWVSSMMVRIIAEMEALGLVPPDH